MKTARVVTMTPAFRSAINKSLSEASIYLQDAYSKAIRIEDLALAASLKQLGKDLGIALSQNQHADDSGRSQVLS